MDDCKRSGRPEPSRNVDALRVRDGLRMDDAGPDVLVLDPDGDVVHRVDGVGADVLRRVRDRRLGMPLSIAESATIEELVTAGIVTDDRGVSRRKVMIAGGVAWTAATVTTFALANPAAAATGCPGGITPSPPDQYAVPGRYAFTTAPGTGTLLVRCWGGGGGGGGAGGTIGGGGGGGGAYAGGEIDVLECTAYRLVVAGGGGGGVHGDTSTPGGSGGPGGQSQFADPAQVWADGGDGGAGGSRGNPRGGSGGQDSASSGVNVYSGGDGGASGGAHQGGGGGGGSAGSGGPGTAGTTGTNANVAGGAGGAGSPGGALGGTGTYDGAGGAGSGPGGGGGGGGGGTSNHAGGTGADGAVWVGL